MAIDGGFLVKLDRFYKRKLAQYQAFEAWNEAAIEEDKGEEDAEQLGTRGADQEGTPPEVCPDTTQHGVPAEPESSAPRS